MANPREVRPGALYMITRRCYQRTFRLRPSDETNAILRFCLALAASKTRVDIHGAVFMSNHHHIVVRDAEGRLPEFLREFHRLTAKALNALQGQRENLWSAERTHVLELADEEQVVENLAYVMANPVEAGLVANPSEWPGVLIGPVTSEQVTIVGRPKAYFGANSSAPERVALRIQPVRGIENVIERVWAIVGAAVASATVRLRAEGRTFLGSNAVTSTSFVRRARSRERMWQRIPTTAARRPDLRRKMQVSRREFLRAYFDALGRWRSGERDAVFPFGTWWMRVFHRVVTAPGPTPVAA